MCKCAFALLCFGNTFNKRTCIDVLHIIRRHDFCCFRCYHNDPVDAQTSLGRPKFRNFVEILSINVQTLIPIKHNVKMLFRIQGTQRTIHQ